MNEHDIPSPTTAHLPPLDVSRLETALAGLHLGHPLIYYPAIGSTNTRASELAQEGAAEGTVVTTDDQTAGRGRIGRTWKSLPGQQLALSLILRPAFPRHFLMMASALAVTEAIEAATGLRAGIKWPNDVLVSERKVCGILIDSRDEYAILGIGINVNGSLAPDPELAARATTLEQAAGRAVPREAIAIELLRRLEPLYDTLQTGGDEAQQAVRDLWRARLAMLARRVTIRQDPGPPREGIAEDVTEGGALLLRRDDGTLDTITWGDVES
jgi:BirA family biotin operon repressor/biotin-[acetyl-CoA-carboxylase] ligase